MGTVSAAPAGFEPSAKALLSHDALPFIPVADVMGLEP
jgi:hypothetical protein